MVRDVNDQPEKPIDEIVPGVGGAIQAPLEEQAVDFREAHEMAPNHDRGGERVRARTDTARGGGGVKPRGTGPRGKVNPRIGY